MDKETIARLLELPMEAINQEDIHKYTIDIIKMKVEEPENISELLKTIFLMLSEVATSAITDTLHTVLDKETIDELTRMADEDNQEKMEKELQQMIQDYKE